MITTIACERWPYSPMGGSFPLEMTAGYAFGIVQPAELYQCAVSDEDSGFGQ